MTARLLLCVTPKASRDAITGWHAGRLKVSVTAAPERGKANAAVISLLATSLGVAKSALKVVSGATRSDKAVECHDLDQVALNARIDSLVPGRPISTDG